ncbi:Protein CBG12958 [Caenorhabditis briggsae]|uniref:Protein CBG12958 n=1 Tax=Caenorhabditis briggsae TaxID=6238 RepID=A8XGR7_CAEBR|nr:Protein CBG12958 [Caenorhabditis briggsae]CAP31841.2 Protein CBG12958 [Caenorhabditis briggsae]
MTTDEPSSSISQELITVVSSDGKDFELTVELAQQSETLAKLIANFDYHLKDVKKEPIPLGNIASAQMEKIPNSELFELMSAANYLNIQHLYETLCRRIASKIAGKTSSEMRQALNLKSDEEIKAAEIDEEEEEEKEEDDESSSEDQEMSDISLSPEPPIND